MLIILIAAVSILFMFNYVRTESIGRSFANTWITMTLYIWAMTEIFSVFQCWTSMTVFGAWLVALVIIIAWGYKKNYWVSVRNNIFSKKVWKAKYAGYGKWFIIIGAYFLFVLIVGILSSQYNVDSLVYHLPRIMHWIQNKSVGYYAAGFEAQVRYPCLTEYLVGQIYLLAGNDRLANLVQTIAYIGSSVMVFSISRKIGASCKAAFTASCIYLLMPMAVAQAYSTQTDNVAGLFLLVYVYYILDFIQAEQLKMDRKGLSAAVFLAASVMLGYLCKPTICFVMVVFFIWMCIVRLIKKDSLVVLLQYVVVGALTALILLAPLYIKNHQTYIVTDQEAVSQEATSNSENESGAKLVNTNQALTPDVFNVQNALKDPTLLAVICLQNVGRNSFSTCFPKYNEEWLKLITKVGGWLNQDVSTFRIPDDVSLFYQDMASNPCVMFLSLFMCLMIICRISKTGKRQTLYAVCAVIGFLAQCGLMGYTHYRTRYLIGAMAVLCPAIAVTIDNLRIKENGKDIIMALCIFGALFGGINTYSYELPRIRESFEGEKIHQYFIGDVENEYVYAELSRIINENKYSTIGLDGLLYLEYPLWQTVDNLERIDSVNVTNQYLEKYADKTYEPDCVVKVVSEEEPVEEGDLLECNGITYQCIWSIHWYQSYFCLFEKG